MTKDVFIKTLAALAQAECKKRDRWILPSVCIAQAALETGWGRSSLMVKANAFFGIKAGTSWKGKVYSAKTQECYDGRTYTTINDLFRAYNSLEDSVADYYDLLTKNARYAKACNCKDAKATITAIRQAGYATSPTYITNVMNVITSNNLTKYDSFATVPAETTAATTTKTSTTAKTYTVKSGDNLTKIARANGTTVAAILKANKKKYPRMTANFIMVGWVLTV